MNKDQQELFDLIQKMAEKHATPGEQCLIGMLGLILSHIQQNTVEFNSFREQFTRMTNDGKSIIVEAA